MRIRPERGGAGVTAPVVKISALEKKFPVHRPAPFLFLKFIFDSKIQIPPKRVSFFQKSNIKFPKLKESKHYACNNKFIYGFLSSDFFSTASLASADGSATFLSSLELFFSFIFSKSSLFALSLLFIKSWILMTALFITINSKISEKHTWRLTRHR